MLQKYEYVVLTLAFMFSNNFPDFIFGLIKDIVLYVQNIAILPSQVSSREQQLNSPGEQQIDW